MMRIINSINKIYLNNNSTIKLLVLGAILVTCVIIYTLSGIQYVYAITDAPIITSLIIYDPDNLDVVYSVDDTIIIIFDSDTNMPGGVETQLTSAINDMFLFSDSIGMQYTGLWVDLDIFKITIQNITGANISTSSTTVTPSGITPILSYDGTSTPSTITSPVLSGDFGVPLLAEPVMIPIITVDDKGYVGIIIEEPASKLQVIDGYVQLDTVSGVPPTIDCDSMDEYGRMKVDDTINTAKLYICTPIGWFAPDSLFDIVKPMITDVWIDEVAEDDPGDVDYAKTGDQIRITFTVSESIQTPVVDFTSLSGEVVDYANPSGNTWTATTIIPAGAPDGTITYSITVMDIAGNTKIRTSGQIAEGGDAQVPSDGSLVIIDNTIPSLLAHGISFISNTELQLTFSEIITTNNIAIGAINYNDGVSEQTTTPSANMVVGNSFIKAFTTSGIPQNAVSGTVASFTVEDRAGNQLVDNNGDVIQATDTTPNLDDNQLIITLTPSTFITSIDASAAINLDNPPKVILSGSTPSTVDIIITPPATAPPSTITLIGGTAVTLGSPVIEISLSTVIEPEFPGPLEGQIVHGTILQLGDPDTSIEFNQPLKIVLNDQGEFTPFIIEAGSITAVPIALCSGGPYTTITASANPAPDLDDVTDVCYDVVDPDLVIWSRHVSSFGALVMIIHL